MNACFVILFEITFLSGNTECTILKLGIHRYYSYILGYSATNNSLPIIRNERFQRDRI